MARRDKPIPTGRVRRTARVGGLVGGQAAKAYANKARNLTRTEERRREANARRQAEAAEEIVEVLGSMKGAAMKVGQVVSFMDPGGLPPEARERFQAKLGELRDSAPSVSFDEMRKVIEQDLGDDLEDEFEQLDEEPIAAASIGQVYRGRLRDGREVAVKVQYPGIAQAVRADLQNLGLILRAARRLVPRLDAKAMAQELRERVTEELDYEHEAQSQRAFARLWRGHPFVVVPGVVTELSRERVLVTEFVDGKPFEQVKRLPQPERNRFGEIVFRFFLGSLYRNAHFSGDPHPGNFLLLGDGRVAFLDFGMTKKVSRQQVEEEMSIARAILANDSGELARLLVEMGVLEPDDPKVTPDALLDYYNDAVEWYRDDREVRLDQDYVGRLMLEAGDPRSRHWELIKRQTLPPEALLARRMEALTLGVLGALDVSANWHRIACEWIYDDPPQSELGRAEADFFARGPSTGRRAGKARPDRSARSNRGTRSPTATGPAG